MTEETTLAALRLNVKLEGYCEIVMTFLAMDELDDYCTKFCAYYMERGIPAVIAAQNIRRSLTPYNEEITSRRAEKI